MPQTRDSIEVTVQGVPLRISLRWLIYIIHPVDKTNDYLVIHPTDEEPQFHQKLTPCFPSFLLQYSQFVLFFFIFYSLKTGRLATQATLPLNLPLPYNYSNVQHETFNMQLVTRNDQHSTLFWIYILPVFVDSSVDIHCRYNQEDQEDYCQHKKCNGTPYKDS